MWLIQNAPGADRLKRDATTSHSSVAGHLKTDFVEHRQIKKKFFGE